MGASAGGVDALLKLLSALPAHFRLPVITVLHLPQNRDSQLAAMFQQRTTLQVREAEDKETICPATLYFAPSGYHLSIEADHSFSLSNEEPKHFSRPSIDLLMQSAADAYGVNLAGIVLTGANDDGAAGLARIHHCGGLTVVQEPLEAQAAHMPKAAIRAQQPDLILRLEDIRRLLLELDKDSC
jgi:two-component system chemotaxis response regulator CheB